MIDTLYKTVQTILNKNQRGKITPAEFNHIANEAVNTVYAELFADFRKSNFKKSRLQDTPNYGSEAFNLKQAIEYWVEEEDYELNEDGKLELPTEVFILNSVFGDDAEYYKTDLKQFNMLVRSGRMKPTECSPIYALFNSTIKVSPIPEDKSIDLTYYRKAKAPKWTYMIVNGAEMFNPDAGDYQDLDIHPMLLHRLFVEVLFLAGLNLREPEVAQAVAQMKQIEFANEQ